MHATRTILLDRGDPGTKRREILDYFRATYEIDEALFEVMAGEEAFHHRADPLRHPLIFYLGHTACLYINKLIMAKALDRRVNPRYESMFAVGVDEMSWDDLDGSHYDWPPLADVWDYRRQVREVVEERIENLPLELPIGWESPFWAVMMGIEHARIHLETSSVLIRQLPLELVRPGDRWPRCREVGEPPANELVDVAGGEVAIGKAWGHPIYGWDNEYGRHRAQVPPFRASRHLVSNGEFLEFVEDGGYGEERWWTGEGWRWRTWRGVEHPLFWRRREGGSWALRLLAEEIGMPWNWPVEVNQLEAKAFCNWLGARRGEKIRLPGEDEWRLLRERNLDTDQPWWEKAPGNINLEHWASSCPVDRFRQGEFYDLIGNVWQWTETPIYPFEGFRVHPIYDDFSTPTFDDRHNLILGGSWISTGNEATADARYAFRRHFHQHAGFRYVAAEEEAPTYGDPYITERDVTRSCDAHWGMERLGLDNFYRRLAELCAELDAPPAGGSALHINCGTGRLAFELARRAGRVLGLDLSARFIRVPVQLRARGQVHHTLVREGEIDTFHEIRLADLELADAVERVEFFQDNAANLQAKWGSFDLVAATDLLDHMADPRRFLEAVHRFVNPGGLLLLACPWQWEGERTPREKWLGGYKDATGDNQEDREVIGHLLSPHFTPAGEPCTLRRVLHENGRRLTVLDEEVTFWRRSS